MRLRFMLIAVSIFVHSMAYAGEVNGLENMMVFLDSVAVDQVSTDLSDEDVQVVRDGDKSFSLAFKSEAFPITRDGSVAKLASYCGSDSVEELEAKTWEIKRSCRVMTNVHDVIIKVNADGSYSVGVYVPDRFKRFVNNTTATVGNIVLVFISVGLTLLDGGEIFKLDHESSWLKVYQGKI